MILKQHHFLTPERPKPEDYKVNHVRNSYANHIRIVFEGGFAYNETALNRDLSEWESLYGEEEPQPEWVDYPHMKPKKGQLIMWAFQDEHLAYDDEEYDPSDNWRVGEYGSVEADYKWADKATYDTRLQRWKDHQVKFKNFKKHIYGSGIAEFSRDIDDKTVTVCFWPYSYQVEVAILKESEIIFEMTATEIHLQEFEMVLKNRGIKL